MNKKQIRVNFRQVVFQRARYRCESCWCHGHDKNDENDKKKNGYPLDAHHVSPREQMPNGGYVLANGISLCPGCHLEAELYLGGTSTDPRFSPENLYRIINSSYSKAVEDSARVLGRFLASESGVEAIESEREIVSERSG